MVIAAAMNVAVGRRVRELIRRDQVAPAHGDGIERKLLGDAVHDALPDEAHSRLADAAVGNDRALVGDNRSPLQPQVLHLVGVEQVVQLVREVNRQRADRSSDVVGIKNLESEHLAAGRDRRLDVELLLAGVPARHHVLAAVLDPFDGTPGPDRHERGEDGVLPNEVNLLSESAADVGDDDANGVDAERLGERFVDDVGRLRVAPDRQPLRRVLHEAGKRLERRGAVAMNLQILANDPVGPLKRAVDVSVRDVALPGDVAAQLLVDQRRCRTGCGTGAGDGRERLVLHVDQIQRVFGPGARVGGNDRHWFADVSHLVDRAGVFRNRDSQPGRVPPGLEGFREPFHVIGCDDAFHAAPGGLKASGYRPRCYPYGCNPGVGVWAPQDARVQHPREDEVVHKTPAAGHVARRLLAATASSYVCFVFHCRSRAAACLTASTICT